MAFDLKKEYKVFYMPKNKPEIVIVPKANYKIEGFFEYVVPPLEGFWWQENTAGVDYTDKALFNWISVIRLPDFITKENFKWAVEIATVALMDTYLEQSGYVNDMNKVRLHHEIYLSDPRKVASEKCKTKDAAFQEQGLVVASGLLGGESIVGVILAFVSVGLSLLG